MTSNQAVKIFPFLTMILATAFSSLADVPTLPELSSHLFTNAFIVWQAPTNHLPKSLWVYQRLLPRVFSETVISNAIVLGSLQSKGFPKPSTNETCIVAEPPCPCGNVCNFFINPNGATMNFESPDYKNGSPKGIPDDQTIVKRAWGYAPQLGVDPTHLSQTALFTHFYNADQTANGTTNFVCGRGVFLARQLDGVNFFSPDNIGDGAEGFSIEFGSYGQIRFFSFLWSNVERYEKLQTASPQEIIHCIEAHKTIVLPTLMKKIILRDSKNWRVRRNSPSSKLHHITAKACLEKCPQTMCLVNLQRPLPNWKPWPISETAMPPSEFYLPSFRQR